MPSFQYIAKDAAGQSQTGVLQAESESAAARSLAERSLYPVRVTAQDDHGTSRGGRGLSFSFGHGVKLRDLGAAYGQLADLLGASVPALRALDILAKATVNPNLKQVLADVRDGVSAGQTLSDSMAKHPNVFKPLHVAMVRAGEHAGFLEQVLNNLATFLERQDELRSKVRGAMIYPVILAVFGFCAVLAIMIFLVPKFQQFLSRGTLPLPTQILFSASGLVRDHFWVLAVGLVVVVVLIRSYIRSESGRRHWAVWQLKVPLAGRAVRMVAITRFCRVLGTLLANGVPIMQALEISKDATGNDLLAVAIEKAADNVRAGQPLAEPLAKCGLFPPEIVEMIAIGEESNQLEKVLTQVADAVERRTNRQVDAAVRLIEPLMLMIMAGAIGFIAVALLYPIFTMAQMMQH